VYIEPAAAMLKSEIKVRLNGDWFLCHAASKMSQEILWPLAFPTMFFLCFLVCCGEKKNLKLFFYIMLEQNMISFLS